MSSETVRPTTHFLSLGTPVYIESIEKRGTIVQRLEDETVAYVVKHDEEKWYGVHHELLAPLH